MSATQATLTPTATPKWWQGVSKYQWLVLAIAWMGWVFDAMDSTLYVLVLHPALHDLLGHAATKAQVATYGSYILAMFLLGWAIGGIGFGILADKWGRAKVMALTILIYALFTGLAAFAQNWWQLGIFRFLTALGVGGEWACGVTLVAEVFPKRSRTQVAGILNAAWGAGFFLAATVNFSVTSWVAPLLPGIDPWRMVFVVGILPAFVAAAAQRKLHEPEKWVEAQVAAKKAVAKPGLAEIFEPQLIKNTIVGSLLASCAVIGLWGVTYWTPSFIRELPEVAGWTAVHVSTKIDKMMMVLNVGAILGYLSYWPLANIVGRKRAFLVFFGGSLLLAQITFFTDRSLSQLFYLLPTLAFFNSGIFSGFAGYFPELFPARVRTTGAGFCFNVGRTLAAIGPLTAAYLVTTMGTHAEAARMVAWIYALGLFVIPFALETKGRELPD